jgi:cytoskeletal protein CcmA (bactofilin family)
MSYRLLVGFFTLTLLSAQALAKSGSDYTQFGHDIRIEADQKAGEVTCFGCSVYVRGQVAGDITTFGGNVVLEEGGMIAGEVTSFWGDVRAAGNTKLAGDITVMGGRLRRDPTAMVAGEVTTFQSHGLVLIILLSPFLVLAGIIALIIWLVRRNRQPNPAMARAA